MNVKAKFICISVTKSRGGKYNERGVYETCIVYGYKFIAVTTGSVENKRFYASTPNGSIELQAIRDDLFEINKEYYLDFSKAEEPLPDKE